MENKANEDLRYTETYDIDMSGKITYYHQGNYGCAATCVCMCMKKSPAQVKLDHPNADLNFIQNWSELTGWYGYTTDPSLPETLSGYQTIFNILKSQGYPVIVKVNDSEDYNHWVVVTKYKGPGKNFSPEQFTCADPANSKGNNIPLNQAANFKDVYKYIVVKKK